MVSPNGARLSITTSAISLSRLPLGCFGVDGVGVFEARHRDDLVALGLRLQRHPDDRPVDAGVRRDDEDVGGVDQGDGEQFVDDGRDRARGSSRRARRRRGLPCRTMSRSARFRRDESACAAGDLHGECLGVAGSECLHDPACVERRDDEVDRVVVAAAAAISAIASRRRVAWSRNSGTSQVAAGQSWRSSPAPSGDVAFARSRRDACARAPDGGARRRPSPMRRVSWRSR